MTNPRRQRRRWCIPVVSLIAYLAFTADVANVEVLLRLCAGFGKFILKLIGVSHA